MNFVYLCRWVFSTAFFYIGAVLKYLFFISLYFITSYSYFLANDIDMSIDIVQYASADSLTECKIHYSYADTAMRYITKVEGYSASILFNATCIDIRTNKQITKEWIVDNISQKPIVLHEKNMIGSTSIFLYPGNYTFTLSAKDLNDTNRIYTSSNTIRVTSYNSQNIQISDPLFAIAIDPIQNDAPSKWSSQFSRNGLAIIPIPTLEIIGLNPSLQVYSEIYHCSLQDSLDMYYQILDAAKRELVTIPLMRLTIAVSQTEQVIIPLDGLASGVYYLNMKVSSRKQKDSATVEKRFYVINPEMPPEIAATFSEDELFQQSEFSTYSEYRIIEEYERAKCLANSSEIALFESLTLLNAQQKFMYRFWKERDPNTDTPINERLEEFRKSVEYAQSFFSCPQYSEGWKSERGRVMRKYGKPTQVDRKYMGNSSRPYEIWFYSEIQGGATFNFVDMKDINNHILVHSTAIGELRNENWYNEFANTDSNNAAGTNTGVPR